MTLERLFRRYLRVRGDYRAARRGPRALASRYARRAFTRQAWRLSRRLFR